MSLRYLGEPCVARIMTWLDADDLSRLLCIGDISLAQKMKYVGRLTLHFGAAHPKGRPMDKSLLANLIMESAPLSELNLTCPVVNAHTAFSPSDVTKFIIQHQHTLKSVDLGFHKTINSVFPYMPELRSLQMFELSGSDRVSLLEVMPNLESLILHRFADPGVESDMTSFRCLTALNLGVVFRSNWLDGVVLPLLVSSFTICFASASSAFTLAPIIKKHPTPFLHFALEAPQMDFMPRQVVNDSDLVQFITAWQFPSVVKPVEAPSNERLANWLATNSLMEIWFTTELKNSFNVPKGSFGVSVYRRKQWTAPLVFPVYEDPFRRQLSKGMHIKLQNGLALQCMPLADQYVTHRRNVSDLVLSGFVTPHRLNQSIQPTSVSLRFAFGDFRLPFQSITHLDVHSDCVSTEAFTIPQTVKSLVVRTSREMPSGAKSICNDMVLYSQALESLVIHYDLPRYFVKPFLPITAKMLPKLKHLSVTLSGNKPYITERCVLWPTSRRKWPQHLETFHCSFDYVLFERDSWAKLSLAHLPPSVKYADIRTVDIASVRNLLLWASRLPPAMTLRLTNCCNNDLHPHLNDSLRIWLVSRLFRQDCLFRPKLTLMDVFIAVVVVLVAWAVMFIFRH
jgi:hypothetical protein